jgi:hypothetical protein
MPSRADGLRHCDRDRRRGRGRFAIGAINIRQPAIRRIAISDAAVKTLEIEELTSTAFAPPKSRSSSLSSCRETLPANDRIVR